MVIVTGSVVGSDESIDELLALSLEHVLRSRVEPGCISHAVHRDVEDPLRLVFLEEWADMDALRTHFAVPESLGFVTGLGALTTAPPTIAIYEATEARP